MPQPCRTGEYITLLIQHIVCQAAFNTTSAIIKNEKKTRGWGCPGEKKNAPRPTYFQQTQGVAATETGQPKPLHMEKVS
jgi:hypothetical protein